MPSDRLPPSPPIAARLASLADLLSDVDVRQVRGDPASVAVRAVTHDSAAVRPGAVFCCLRGSRADGHDFAAAAVEAGAVAVVGERLLPLAADVVQVRVGDSRAAMAPLAAALFGQPSRTLDVVGVTGTNGKTTVTHLLGAVLEADGRPTTVLGTLSGARTTPEAPELQARLAAVRDEGGRAVAMEVSSHALAQHRVDAVRFAVAVFTNLSQDHLDFHGDMDAYFEAKAALFSADRAAHAVVNRDDPWGRRLLERLPATLPRSTYGLDDARDVEAAATWSAFSLDGHPVRLALGGRHNVGNALAAAAAARVLGVASATVAAGLSAAPPVPGRFEPVDAGQGFAVVVDYSHTPDGLAAALTAAREAAPGGRVIVVFGAGGDRDPTKRAPMGEVATRLADLAFLTSDNPRHEDPLAIIDAVRAGAVHTERLVVEPDRALAIQRAVAEARSGDMVVVAGKGHETTQEIGGRSLAFDDRAVARRALEGKLGQDR